MLKFVKRGMESGQPIGNMPLWMSSLLRTRGIDTEEKAERFLHPSPEQLYDPMAMQGMDKAVGLIREAIRDGKRIMIYGDYDVDGVCATSILLETLREEGGAVDFYIPNRHGEGYGLNEEAVRAIAKEHRMLITVDCGVTNHGEVKLAQLLGMTVIVTDHHQLADTPSPADAVLNPLLGDYPFRRLCGAGVALKVCQALQGMDGVMKRIELAALATVADIVPLIDENRVIVRYGLDALGQTTRPGLRALMTLSSVSAPVSAGQVGFRLAPRLNAGGRLEEAAQGVTLLTSRDEKAAERIATHLEENNQQRQAIEQEITQKAMAAIGETADFREDRVLIVMGAEWNSGVIGLAAGRICERYHFPTIVLSRQGEQAVGSCRSIPGVNIHAMLTTCKDLFLRFGGHEMAAGLTMRAELVPELRRRLNLAISESCDPGCYVPTQEYDLVMPLGAVDLPLIEALEALQPTGFGNPAPVFLTQGAQVQQARRVGKEGRHLKLTLLEGDAVRDGIAFSMGDMAEEGLERVDVLFSPERNEYMGRVTPQMQVKALRSAEGAAPLPPQQAFFRALLQEIAGLAANTTRIPTEGRALPPAAVKKLLTGGRGTLLIAHERERAATFAVEGRLDIAVGHVRDPRGFNTLLCAPEISRLTDVWQDIVLLDGDVLPGETALLRARCPRARLHAMKANPRMEALLAEAAMDRETLGELYRGLKVPSIAGVMPLTEASGLTETQVLTGLAVLSELGLIDYTPSPFSVRRRVSPQKRDLNDSGILQYFRQAQEK